MNLDQIEYQIESLLASSDSDFIIFDQLLKTIAEQNDITVKEIKSILYQKKSLYYGTSGYIDGKRISIQNLSISSKRVFKKIIEKIEKSLGNKLIPEEKIKIIKIIEYSLGEM